MHLVASLVNMMVCMSDCLSCQILGVVLGLIYGRTMNLTLVLPFDLDMSNHECPIIRFVSIEGYLFDKRHPR